MQDIDQFIEQSKALTIEYNEALTWQTNSTLELSVVDYKIDDAYLLKDINLSLPEKGLIGLVGASGAGKSTLINVLAGRTEVTQQIGLTDFVNELPLGMDELIGESGRSVSGGQEQRIAMARALLSDKPIILLDEPTAHLDIETEYDIKHVILELFKDKLMVIATHRLHWMQDLDYIYMLDEGEIIASGTEIDLLETSEAYQLLNNRKRGN